MKTFHSIIIFCFIVDVKPIFLLHHDASVSLWNASIQLWLIFRTHKKISQLFAISTFDIDVVAHSSLALRKFSLLAVNCNLIISIFLLANFSLRTYSLIHLLCCIIIGNFPFLPNQEKFFFLLFHHGKRR